MARARQMPLLRSTLPSLYVLTKRVQVIPADSKDKITAWLQFNRRVQARSKKQTWLSA